MADSDYTFGSSMGDANDSTADSLSDLLTYGAESNDETTGQPGGAPNVKSDASAPIAPASHIAALTSAPAAAVTRAPAAPTSAPSQASQAPLAPVAETMPQNLTAAKQADSQVSNVSPKWWERTLGGLTAGAMAFGHMPGAVEAGQAVTNRGQNAAEEQRRGRLAADDVAIQAWQDGQKQKQQDFANQTEAYRTKQEGVRSDQEAAAAVQSQSNADRNFNRDTANDKFNQGRETADDTWEHGFQTTNQTETKRRDDAEIKNMQANTGINAARNAREAAKQTADDRLTSPEVQQQKAAAATQDKYRTQIDQIENGNPKGSTVDETQGFKTTYRKASGELGINPETQRLWLDPKDNADGKGADRQAAYLDNLKQQNADRKNSVMQSFAADMTTLGRPTPIIVYDKEGRSTTQQPQTTSGNKTSQSTTNNVTPTPTQVTIQKPPRRGTPLTDRAIVKAYIDAAGGDPAKAREAAAKDGWSFGKK